jgi:hypothetical protein
MRPVLATLLFLLFATATAAQPVDVREIGVVRDTLLANRPQPFQLLPFILVDSESVNVNGVLLRPSEYRIDHRFGRLWIFDPPSVPDAPVVVTYRTLPFSFETVYGRVPGASGTDSTATRDRERHAATAGLERLNRSGSITRGVVTGSNRDAVVQSALRIRLHGEIADGVEVEAVLTDEQAPVVPDGNTQRLMELDRVYIRLATRYGAAQLGDIDAVIGGGTFGRMTRMLQGAQVTVSAPGPLGMVVDASAVGASARGTFRTQQIQPIDGVQGPYRLEGDAGERFVLVVPGSEVVYLNGERLRRGDDADYVIDYGTGEIRFTPRRLITRDRRIAVEFQYRSFQYTRTIVGTHVGLRSASLGDREPRLRLGMSFIREADGRAFPEEMGLTTADSLALAGAGNGLALRSGADPVRFDPEAPFVQYRMQVMPDGDSIFVAISAAPLPGEQVYRVRFAFVGPNQGTYVRGTPGLNGVVYEWRGQGAGDYAPVRLLPRPESHQVMSAHATAALLPHLEVFGEWGHSVRDRNRLSTIGNEDNGGLAYAGGIRLTPLTITAGRLPLTLSAAVKRQSIGATFSAFDRIRPVDHVRLWNLPFDEATSSMVGGGDETLDEFRFDVVSEANAALSLEVGRFNRADILSADRQAIDLSLAMPGLPGLTYRGQRAASASFQGAAGAGTWTGHSARLFKSFLGGRLIPRIDVESENRQQRPAGSDSLARTSLSFTEIRPGAGWETERLALGGGIGLRREAEWDKGSLVPAAVARTFTSEVRWRPGPYSETSAAVTIRSRTYDAYFRSEYGFQDGETVSMQWRSNLRPQRGPVHIDWAYDALTERSPRLQEIFVRVGSGLGEYVWVDSNNDGIVQLDELIPERIPGEGAYMRTFIPSDTLMPVASVNARLVLDADPSRWQALPARLHWLKPIASRTVIEIQEKNRGPDELAIYLLDLARFRDPENTLMGRLRLGQELFLFRNQPRFGLDLGASDARAFSSLSAGQEDRRHTAWRADSYYRFSERWRARILLARERNATVSQSFASRTFDIRASRAESDLSWSPSRGVSLRGGVATAFKIERLGGREATILRLPFEVGVNPAERVRLNARFEAAQVSIRGASAVGLSEFELTDGRGPGRSGTWSLGGEYLLNSNVRASIFYDGRKTEGRPLIQTARVQVSAAF